MLTLKHLNTITEVLSHAYQISNIISNRTEPGAQFGWTRAEGGVAAAGGQKQQRQPHRQMYPVVSFVNERERVTAKSNNTSNIYMILMRTIYMWCMCCCGCWFRV